MLRHPCCSSRPATQPLPQTAPSPPPPVPLVSAPRPAFCPSRPWSQPTRQKDRRTHPWGLTPLQASTLLLSRPHQACLPLQRGPSPPSKAHSSSATHSMVLVHRLSLPKRCHSMQGTCTPPFSSHMRILTRIGHNAPPSPPVEMARPRPSEPRLIPCSSIQSRCRRRRPPSTSLRAPFPTRLRPPTAFPHQPVPPIGPLVSACCPHRQIPSWVSSPQHQTKDRRPVRPLRSSPPRQSSQVMAKHRSWRTMPCYRLWPGCKSQGANSRFTCVPARSLRLRHGLKPGVRATRWETHFWGSQPKMAWCSPRCWHYHHGICRARRPVLFPTAPRCSPRIGRTTLRPTFAATSTLNPSSAHGATGHSLENMTSSAMYAVTYVLLALA